MILLDKILMRMRMRMRMRKKINNKKKKIMFLLIKMESQKIINSLEKILDQKNLPKKIINNKKNDSNNKEIKFN